MNRNWLTAAADPTCQMGHTTFAEEVAVQQTNLWLEEDWEDDWDDEDDDD